MFSQDWSQHTNIIFRLGMVGAFLVQRLQGRMVQSYYAPAAAR
jgi:hypothetical protein